MTINTTVWPWFYLFCKTSVLHDISNKMKNDIKLFALKGDTITGCEFHVYSAESIEKLLKWIMTMGIMVNWFVDTPDSQ